MAVLVRLHCDYGVSANLTGELAEEFAAFGWCTAGEYTDVTPLPSSWFLIKELWSPGPA
ncbi:hypothetical protein [Saccharothrix lopnurensis]|uniref:Uncharacterized protein n=1 Tax=Saccharothrix lopnurensis TaxID=1670621 RepID=A0ABW1PHA9_9PSEU